MQPFGPWHPDVDPFASGEGGDKLNVLPTLTGWGPFPQLAIASLPIDSSAPPSSTMGEMILSVPFITRTT